MLRSLFSGITGLRAHQTLMDVVSNNIANVNTTGFKSSSVIFEDTLNQTLRNSGSPSSTNGGINPAQIGLGVQVGQVTTNFTQGSSQNTGKSTDLMIQGDGFFVVRSGNETAYTRSGAFNFDSNGNLVTAEGSVVQGWMGTNGKVNTDAPVTDLKITTGYQVPPTASTKVALGGNITAGTTTTMTVGATVYDATGSAHALSIVLVPNTSTTPQSYDVTVTDTTDSTATPATGTAQFLDATAAAAATPPVAAGSYDPASTAPALTLTDGTAITIDLSGLTQFGGPKSMSVTSADGASSGSLQNFQIGSDGAIVGIFSNGQKLALGMIALANFNNPAGLEKAGNSTYKSTTNSGIPTVGTSATGGRGSLLGGTLEMSNVDLAQEFTNLIIAQRGFQANSRVITTSDQMLQDLVELKR